MASDGGKGERKPAGYRLRSALDLLRAQLRKLVPACTAGEFDSDTLLNCLAPDILTPFWAGRLLRSWQAFVLQRHVPLHDLWLSRSHAIHDGRKALVNVDRHVGKVVLLLSCACTAETAYQQAGD